MNKKLKIKKGDNVIVIAGKDKGKSGNITAILKQKERVLVQGVNIVKKHRKPTQESPGKIEEIEASIHISNVAHVNPDTGKATRVKFKIEDGVKKRFSVSSDTLLDK